MTPSLTHSAKTPTHDGCFTPASRPTVLQGSDRSTSRLWRTKQRVWEPPRGYRRPQRSWGRRAPHCDANVTRPGSKSAFRGLRSRSSRAKTAKSGVVSTWVWRWSRLRELWANRQGLAWRGSWAFWPAVQRCCGNSPKGIRRLRTGATGSGYR